VADSLIDDMVIVIVAVVVDVVNEVDSPGAKLVSVEPVMEVVDVENVGHIATTEVNGRK
jgi:hypothetical protein